MRIVFLFVLLSGNFLLKAQDYLSIAGVFKDSIRIRWVPKTIEAYKYLSNSEFQVKLIPWNSLNLPNKEDFIGFSQAKIFSSKGVNLLVKEDSSVLDATSIILNDGILNSNDSIAQKMIFANTLLLSGSDIRFAKKMGMYAIFKNDWNSTFLAYEIRIGTGHLPIYGVAQMKELEKIRFDSLKVKKDRLEMVLEWNISQLEKTFGSYNILRSEDGKSFGRINELPFFHFTTTDEDPNKPSRYVDKKIEKGKDYYYKLEAVDHLGVSRGTSNVVHVQANNPILGHIFIKDVKYKNEKIEVDIKFKPDSMNTSIVKQSTLLYLENLKSKNRKIQSQDFEYENYQHLIKSKLIEDRGYLMIVLISENGDSLWSEPKYYFFRDSIPPKRPKGLIGFVDTNGLVNLRWSRVEDHLLGYRMFRKNSLGEEFVEVTNEFLQDTSYIDTISLNNLTKEIYYAVVAVDHNHNNSDFSETRQLLKPDLIPPVPSTFRKSTINENGILLSWMISGSKDFQSVELQKEDNKCFQNVFKTNNDTFFLDTDVENGRNYTYRLRTLDESGNEALSPEYELVYELGYRKGVLELSSEIDREKQFVDIFWKNPSQVYAVYIYLGKDDGPIKLHNTLFQNIESFRFQKLSVNHVYRVQVQTMDAHGVLSVLSDVLEIDY
ncbi:MAG: hypothetical protein R2799_05005 [Crocinitomicaceae bacterium]